MGLLSLSSGESPPSALLVDVFPAVLCPASLQACVATMFQCVHFWGWKSLDSSFGHSNDSINDQMTVFQTNMCSVLVRRPSGGRGWVYDPILTFCHENRTMQGGPMLTFLTATVGE